MKYAFAILAALAFATVANGEAIEVANASFEAPALDLGGWSNDLAPNGWTQLPETGSAFIEYIDGFSADGNQHVGMAEGAEVFQDLGVSLLPSTTYQLSVSAGNRNDGFTPEGQNSTFALYVGDAAANGGTLLAAGSFDASTIEDGSFSDLMSVSYTTGDSVAAGNLYISLQSAGAGRAHFDSVSLNAVPEPSSIALAGLACLGMLQIRRRR